MTHSAENGLRNAGPWEHADGTPCPHYWASRPTPSPGQLWWCTEHQKHVQVTSTADNDARPAPCATCGHSEIVPMHTGGRGVICECGCRNYVSVVSRVIPPEGGDGGSTE